MVGDKSVVFGRPLCDGPRMAVAITGMGCVTPIGIGVPAFAQSLKDGVSGTGPLTRFDAEPYECRVAAQVDDFQAVDFMSLRQARALPRVVQMGVAAARMAMEDAGIGAWADPNRVGVVAGSTGGPGSYHFEQGLIFVERGLRRMHPMFPAYGHLGSVASECAIQLDAHGPVFTVSSACTSSTDAIGMARAMIEGGLADVIVTGGTDCPLWPMLFGSFDRLKVMAREFNDRPEAASRPFSKDRDGFVMGEAAAMFVLERSDLAAKRGARVYAEVSGYGATCDADNHFSQEESGRDAIRAVEEALRQAGIEASELDYVNAHGSSTPANDSFETGVLKHVLGESASNVPVSATKSLVGHTFGACGAVEIAATLAGMREGFVPPTVNLEERDPECDLDYVSEGCRTQRIDMALSTNFGFGSRNAALVLRRCE